MRVFGQSGLENIHVITLHQGEPFALEDDVVLSEGTTDKQCGKCWERGSEGVVWKQGVVDAGVLFGDMRDGLKEMFRSSWGECVCW